MILPVDLSECACFGVAGNFTGHLEQAGEARDFKNVKTAEANAPKALFPTYIPKASVCTSATPAFLHTFPFCSDRIIFPPNESKLQLEPECGIVFEAVWNEGKVTSLKPVCFGASNDCSIRKEGARKISEKKNWGKCSKGFSNQQLLVSSFTSTSELNDYRIASFLVRDGKIYDYGEDSAVRDYSYIYEKLENWLIEKLNGQQDEGPAENINGYLVRENCPSKLFISIGATRYTDFGEHNFLQNGDETVVVVYPQKKYTLEQVRTAVEKQENLTQASILRQLVIQ